MKTRRHEKCQNVHVLLLSIPAKASCLTPLGKRRKRAAGRGAGAGRKLRRTLSGGRHVDDFVLVLFGVVVIDISVDDF